jgi:hypothetical protein
MTKQQALCNDKASRRAEQLKNLEPAGCLPSLVCCLPSLVCCLPSLVCCLPLHVPLLATSYY